MSENTNFTNRKGSNLNRRKLTIISQTPDQMIVDIERADSATVKGSIISADTLNDFQYEINTANSNASSALSTANSASTVAQSASTTANSANQTATSANTKATTALSNSQTALTTANEAKAKALEVEGKLADRGAVITVNGKTETNLTFIEDPQTQITTNSTSISNINNSITNITNNTTKLQNAQGGFTAGNSSQATAGGAVGMNTTTTSGFAGGHSATSDWGGAVGVNASTQLGGAIGSEATSTNGGAIGSYTKTGNGFAGGYNARTTDAAGNGLDAIQLGTGTNSTAKTLQVYGFPVLDAAGNIDTARIQHFFTGNKDHPDLITSKSLASNGYIKFQSGLTIQWGKTSRIADYKSLSVTFPSTSLFSATPKVAVSNEYSSDDGTWNSAFYVVEGSISKSGFQVYSRGNKGGGRFINWIAIGY